MFKIISSIFESIYLGIKKALEGVAGSLYDSTSLEHLQADLNKAFEEHKKEAIALGEVNHERDNVINVDLKKAKANCKQAETEYADAVKMVAQGVADESFAVAALSYLDSCRHNVEAVEANIATMTDIYDNGVKTLHTREIELRTARYNIKALVLQSQSEARGERAVAFNSAALNNVKDAIRRQRAIKTAQTDIKSGVPTPPEAIQETDYLAQVRRDVEAAKA